MLMMTTDGGPANATLMIGLYLYRQAFVLFKMGYASAMAWVLLMVIMPITVASSTWHSHWVYLRGRPKRS